MENAQPQVTEVAAAQTVSPVEGLKEVVNAATEAKTDKPVESTEPKVEAPKQDDKFSSKFAALSRKEKMLLDKERQLKTMEDKFKNYEAIEKRVKSNPLEFLKEYGFTYSDLTNFVLNDGKPTPDLEVKSVREEMAALKKELEERETKKQQEHLETTLKAFKADIGKYVKSDVDKYELLNLSQDPVELVYSIIEEHFKSTETVLTTQEAADAAEKYLEDEAKKYLGVKKFQQKQETTVAKPAAEKTMSTTLSNSMDSKSPSTPDELDPNDPLFMEKSRERAAKLLKFR